MVELKTNGQRYEVHFSSLVAKSVRQIQRRASSEGQGDVVLAVFRRIVRTLEHDPQNFGEALYDLPAMQI